ncbi:MAG: sigma-70 family RNA polymerase sigma factor [Pseudomonadota bacterium]
MTRARASQGLDLLVEQPKVEASEWRRLRTAAQADARTALFARYRRFAQTTARTEHQRIKDMGLDRCDCEQLAYEALLHSIERFDPNKGVPFTAFARPRIRGAIRNGLTKANEARASFNARKRAEKDRLESLKKQAANADEDDPMETLRDLVVGMALGFMLEENAQSKAEQVPSDAPSAYDGVVWNQTVIAMEDKLSSLPEQERQVLDYHYKQGLRFTQIATLLGLTRGRISQIHSKALARLRQSLSKFR